MTTEFDNTLENCDNLLNQLEPELRIRAAARLFMEHCLSEEAQTSSSHLAPLINTVADALTKDLDIEKRLEIGVKTVQTYLRVPAIEFFGDTLIRQKAISNEERNEMLSIKPDGAEFGSFLMEQGVISQDQRDVAIITQKRLLSIKEVYSRLLQTEGLEIDEMSIIDNLKSIIDHFLTSTHDLEKSIQESRRENTKNTLSRLENIIHETEVCTHNVLEIVDKIFILSDEVETFLAPLATGEYDSVDKIQAKLQELRNLNMELNESQGIQDRIGQQLTKIIPTIQAFHDQLMTVAQKLKINIEAFEEEENLLQEGYEKGDDKRMADQGDVDDLLSSLGL